jgi:DNA-binding NarL/FixJ family response regulator
LHHAHTEQQNQYQGNQVNVKKILIVDDSVAIRRTLRTLLCQRPEWELCGEAANGREGVEQAQRLRPDLILMDFSMPIMNGFQAARELKKLMPEVPILMFTIFKTTQMENEASAIGVSAVHSKFDAVDRLFSSIQGLLKAA